MSGLLITVAEFRHRTANDMNGLVRSLKDLTGRGGEAEEQAWRHSLPAVAKAFTSPHFDNLHLYFGGQGRLALEYRLPSAPYWCDMVMLGANDGQPTAVIVELKDWQTRADKPATVEGLMIRQGRTDLHPSDQVKGYTEYCRRFHSAVAAYQAEVHGCVLFTRDYFCQTYSDPPNDILAQAYPLFTLSPTDVANRLPKYFLTRISEPHEQFAEEFARGVYHQNRSFVRAVAEQLADANSSPLELLDGQRRALHLCKQNLESLLLEERRPQKTVVVIEGPPGSGKSVVAARLWANLAIDTRLPEGNVTFVTTSTAQTSNWRSLFSEAAEDVAARGLVVTANEYIPFTTQDVGRIQREHPGKLADIGKWRDNYKLMLQLFPDRHRTPDDHFLVSIVDEAHALINPEHTDARGQFGFAVNVGPQAYHIIRSSMISIFFLDPQQSFRERESTEIPDIKKWANELSAEIVGPISLADAQFRCSGSKEYVDWVEGICSNKSQQDVVGVREASAQYSSVVRPAFEFVVFNTPFELENSLRELIAAGHSARLVASYAREWKTGDVANPHELPVELKDFVVPVRVSEKTRYWSKVWNYIPQNGRDYTSFIRAPTGSHMHDDPLAEVGCPYVVRGFDFDYIGLLWFGDLKWRKRKWIVDLDYVFESGLARHKQRALGEQNPDGPAHQALIEKLLQGYRILLTRAMRGMYVWFEDTETRQYIEDCNNPLFHTGPRRSPLLP